MPDNKTKKTNAGKVIQTILKPFQQMVDPALKSMINVSKKLSEKEKNKSTFKNRDIDRITHGKGRPLGRKI